MRVHAPNQQREDGDSPQPSQLQGSLVLQQQVVSLIIENADLLNGFDGVGRDEGQEQT